MNSLLQVVKSHFFLQFVHLNRERGKVTAVTSSGHRGRCEIVAVNRGRAGMAWHSELGGARAVAVNRGERAIHQK